MIPQEILSLILEKLEHYKIGGRQLKALCPLHQERNPSFYLDLELGIWHCFGCGQGGSLKDLLVILFPHSPSIFITKANGNFQKYLEFYEQMPYLLNFAEETKLIETKRKIRQETLGKVNPKWCPSDAQLSEEFRPFAGRVLFPCRHSHSISSFVGYALNGNTDKKYLFPAGLKLLYPFGLGEMLPEIEKSKMLYIVEGIFDALSLWEISLPAIAMLGSSLSSFPAVFPENCQIYLMPDNPQIDKMGQRFAVQWSIDSLLIGRWDAKVAVFSSTFLKDANDALVAGELEEQIEKLRLYPVPEFLIGAAIRHPKLVSLNQVISLLADCLPTDYAAGLIRWLRRKYPEYVLRFQSALGVAREAFEKTGGVEVAWRIVLESAKTKRGREIILSVLLPNEVPYLMQVEPISESPPFPPQKVLEAVRVVAAYLRRQKAKKIKSQLLAAGIVTE
jgi:hypothetical protein